MKERKEVLADLGLVKAPELVTVRGLVSQGVANTLKTLSQEAGIKEEEVVGLAVSDWIRRAEKKLKKSKVED